MIVGEHGLSVLLSPETAYYLERVCNVAALRGRLRDGRHQRVSEELLDLRKAAMSFDPASLPREEEVGSDFPEVAPGSETWLSVAQAADLLGLTERGVRLACREGRIEGEQAGAGRRWRITRQAVKDFKAAPAATGVRR